MLLLPSFSLLADSKIEMLIMHIFSGQRNLYECAIIHASQCLAFCVCVCFGRKKKSNLQLFMVSNVVRTCPEDQIALHAIKREKLKKATENKQFCMAAKVATCCCC